MEGTPQSPYTEAELTPTEREIALFESIEKEARQFDSLDGRNDFWREQLVKYYQAYTPDLIRFGMKAGRWRKGRELNSPAE